MVESNFQQPLTPGMELQLSCKSSGSHPPANIDWELNGNRVKPFKSNIQDNGNTTIGYFYQKISENDDGLKIKCIVTNPSLVNFTLEQDYKINVIYKPRVKIKYSRSINSSSLESGSVTLQCDVLANPSIEEKKWLLNGQPILNTTKMYQNNGSLYIMELNRTMFGTYTCLARNKLGSNNSSFQVNDNYTPVCGEIEISKQYEESLQDRIVANVTCNLLSNPENVTFYWMIRNFSSNHSWSTGHVSHTVVKSKNTNIEIYCWGVNDVGEQKVPCRFNFFKVEKKKHKIDIILIASTALLLCLIAFFIMTRKLHQSHKDFFPQHEEELKSLNGNVSLSNTTSGRNSSEIENSKRKLIIEEEL